MKLGGLLRPNMASGIAVFGLQARPVVLNVHKYSLSNGADRDLGAAVAAAAGHVRAAARGALGKHAHAGGAPEASHCRPAGTYSRLQLTTSVFSCILPRHVAAVSPACMSMHMYTLLLDIDDRAWVPCAIFIVKPNP